MGFQIRPVAGLPRARQGQLDRHQPRQPVHLPIAVLPMLARRRRSIEFTPTADRTASPEQWHLRRSPTPHDAGRAVPSRLQQQLATTTRCFSDAITSRWGYRARAHPASSATVTSTATATWTSRSPATATGGCGGSRTSADGSTKLHQLTADGELLRPGRRSRGRRPRRRRRQRAGLQLRWTRTPLAHLDPGRATRRRPLPSRDQQSSVGAVEGARSKAGKKADLVELRLTVAPGGAKRYGQGLLRPRPRARATKVGLGQARPASRRRRPRRAPSAGSRRSRARSTFSYAGTDISDLVSDSSAQDKTKVTVKK